MLKLGLTGGVGAGKSTAAELFRRSGAAILNTDRTAHEAMRPGSKVWKKLVREFGGEILLENREIDRKKLSHIVFQNRRKLRRLESIVHPEVVRRLKSWFASCRRRGVKLAVVEVPLLFEAKLEKLFDVTVAVTAPRAAALRRCGKRGLSRAEAVKRMRAQMSSQEKARRADFAIANAGAKKDLKPKVQRLLKKLSTELKNR